MTYLHFQNTNTASLLQFVSKMIRFTWHSKSEHSHNIQPGKQVYNNIVLQYINKVHVILGNSLEMSQQ